MVIVSLLPRPVRYAVALVVMLFGTTAHAQVPVDLNTWAVEGPDLGNWQVASDGASVLQTVNQLGPTFFVSPDDLFDQTIDGSFGVETTGDDDYIGFVFGYQGPLESEGDEPTDFEFFLLDWKQRNQTFNGVFAAAGFTLARVDTMVTLGPTSPFWQHDDEPPGFDIIATDYDPARGWADNTVYDFTLLYTPDQIRISIDGGAFDNETIFDVTAADAGLDAFPSGRFGFYNYSQAQVRYAGFTLLDVDEDGIPDGEDNCPATPNADQADADADGVGDVCDNCPATENPEQTDSDEDGLGDVCDNCPAAPNPEQTDSDEDGVGDACDNCSMAENPEQEDSDADGIGDACDNCPEVENPGQEDTDGDGIGDACEPVDVDPDAATPENTTLLDAYPNPAGTRSRATVTVPFYLAEPGPVRITVYDMLGREVATLVDAVQAAGPDEVSWRVPQGDQAAGLYVVQLRVGAESWTQRVLVVR